MVARFLFPNFMAGLFSKIFGGEKSSAPKFPTLHDVPMGSYSVRLHTPADVTVQPSMVGSSRWEGFKTVINLRLPNGYDTTIYPEGVQLDRVFDEEIVEHSRKHGAQKDIVVVERKPNCIIYTAREGKIPFASVLVQVERGGYPFHTVTEQVHFDEDNNALTISVEECRLIAAIMETLEVI